MVLATDNSLLVYQGNWKNIALGFKFVKDVEGGVIDHVHELLFRADKQEFIVNQATPHTVNVKCLYFLIVASLKHIDLIVVIDGDNVLGPHSVDVATGYSIVVAMHRW